MANNVDPAASDLCLHCLQRLICPKRVIRIILKFSSPLELLDS